MNVYRDTGALIDRFVIFGIMNLFFGFIFLNAGGRGNDTNDDFNTLRRDRDGADLRHVLVVMLSFPFERPVSPPTTV